MKMEIPSTNDFVEEGVAPRKWQLVWNGTPLPKRMYVHFDRAEATAMVLLRVLSDRIVKVAYRRRPQEVVQIIKIGSGIVCMEYRLKRNAIEWEETASGKFRELPHKDISLGGKNGN